MEKQQKREAERRADQLFKEEEERRLSEQEQERQLYEQEQAERRFEQEEAQRRRAGGADKLADAYKFDLDVASKPMLSPSVYEDEIYESEEEREETKEEKLAKAEEKIRMAFAGLAQEREQQAPPTPAPNSPLPRSNTIANDLGPGGYGGFGSSGLQPSPSTRQERGVSRYNTTGGAAKLQKRAMPPQVGLVKVNTVSGRPMGLPSGPRAGGLPGGPRPVRR